MKTPKIVSIIILIVVIAAVEAWFIIQTRHQSSRIKESESVSQPEQFIGTSSCRECHEKFYQLWAPSHHGLAMQPFSEELARTQLSAQDSEIEIGDYRYLASFETGQGIVREIGPEGKKEYQIDYALGGKNIYYFLTPMERGRLQVLPVAFDINEKNWYDTTASMVRHAVSMEDEVLSWKDPLLTFNTSCYNCHVSQLSTNYDLKTDSYRTTWAEPGINCETCHGGSREHVRVFREAPEGSIPEDMKIISIKTFTTEEKNAMCAPCHAKMTAITTKFQPGDRYFDHYTLAGFENPDFYPDGRDLGENYTYTLWLTSPCVKSGRLDCMHCHTSSGRYRFKMEQPNNACMPCHAEHVADASAHSHHPANDESSLCISCHMPITKFSRMWRSDHSMRPPTPAVTAVYGSPNACNLCHTDRDAAWSDKYVREWRLRDFQAPVLHRTGLIDTARKKDWRRLDEILAYLTSEERDDVFAASLIRLLRSCDNEKKWPVLIVMLNDPSPLVRESAAESLNGYHTPQAVEALLKATQDEYRLVRIRAAASLAGYPQQILEDQDRQSLNRATAEFEESMRVRPDDYASHFNLGNFYLDHNDINRAITSFEKSIGLRPKSILPLINVSIAYARAGNSDKAEESLRQALQLEPKNPAANLNLGLLLAEQGQNREAEQVLRLALESDPSLAAAAYNLGIILARDRIEETLTLCKRAYQISPHDSKYAYTLAFYLNQTGDSEGAIPILEKMVDRKAANSNIYFLLGKIFEQQGRTEDAVNLYHKAAASENLSRDDRSVFAAKVQRFPYVSANALEGNFQRQDQKIVIKSPNTLQLDNYFVWGGSVVKGEDNRYHMLFSLWESGEEYPPFQDGWLINSKIAYAVSDYTNKGFRFQKIVLSGRMHQGDPSAWDAQSVHNPHIKKFNNKYYLYYIGSRDPGPQPKGSPGEYLNKRNRIQQNQKIGVIEFDSFRDLLTGNFKRPDKPLLSPRTRVKKDNVLNPSPEGIIAKPDNLVVVNPSVVYRPSDGKYLLYFKGNLWDPNWRGVHGVAIGDSPVGPFTALDNFVFDIRLENGKIASAEDPYVWYNEKLNRFYAVFKDFSGKITGSEPGLAVLISTDGIIWQKPINPLFMKKEFFFTNGQRLEVSNLERPQLLLSKDGLPLVLYCACSVEPLGDKKDGSTFNVQIALNIKQ